MTKSLEELLNGLGQAIAEEVTAANDRASAAEAKLIRLMAGLSSLITASPSSDGAGPVPVISTSRRNRNAERTKSISDDVLRSALSSVWMGARQIMNALYAEGHKIAEGTVYNRMRKLAQNCSDVETSAKPERWRLNAPENPSNAAPAVRHSTAQVVAAKSRLFRANAVEKAGQSAATNDNLIVHKRVLHHGDCLEVMSGVADESVDLILVDLPYGVTRLKIDTPINLAALWAEYRRVLKKPHGNIVLFSQQPFTTELINAARAAGVPFKYACVWDKGSATGFQFSSARPMKAFEEVLVFSFGTNISSKRTKLGATFNPQGAVPVTRTYKKGEVQFLANCVRGARTGTQYVGLTNLPRDILRFPKVKAKRGTKGHPFAKPLALLEYLIKTYSNSGETVLDNTMGGGSTGVAALRTGRRFIGIEQDKFWFDAAEKRIMSEAQMLGVEQVQSKLAA